MKVSLQYGPQFDPSDGTVGETQLVRRWGLVKDSGMLFPALQGRYSSATKEEQEKRLKVLLENDPTIDLECVELWCWPGHFDPVQVIKEHGAL